MNRISDERLAEILHFCSVNDDSWTVANSEMMAMARELQSLRSQPEPAGVRVKGQWFDLTGDARLGRCATEGCGGQPTARLEAGGVGSNYCSGCAASIRALTERQGEAHPDDIAVDRFAGAMKTKLAKKRAEGRGGWDRKDECSPEFLSQLLREHIGKGDPVDVGNLAMMLHQRGERITK